jgi:non-heme chloroperoxidase
VKRFLLQKNIYNYLSTMKIIFFWLLFATAAFGQSTDPFAAFESRKKTIFLPTGITLKYIETGNEKGIPVILLHGYTDTGRSFQMTIDEMVALDPNLRVIAPDQRGHGSSSMPDARECAETPEKCFEPAEFAADIIALMDQKGIERAHIVGHSMGSVVAQEIALKHPERVHSMTLIGALVNAKESAVVRDFFIKSMIEGTWRPLLEKRPGFRWPEDAYDLLPADLGPDMAAFLKDAWVFDPTAREDFIQAVLQETSQTRLGTWIGVIKALSRTDNREALQNLKTPTLILWASQDNAFPEIPDQQWLKTAFEAAALKTGVKVIYKTYGKKPLPESGLQTDDFGHNLQFGAPAAVAADIVSFIQKGQPKSGLPYADPSDLKKTLVEPGNGNLIVWKNKQKL